MNPLQQYWNHCHVWTNFFFQSDFFAKTAINFNSNSILHFLKCIFWAKTTTLFKRMLHFSKESFSSISSKKMSKTGRKPWNFNVLIWHPNMFDMHILFVYLKYFLRNLGKRIFKFESSLKLQKQKEIKNIWKLFRCFTSQNVRSVLKVTIRRRSIIWIRSNNIPTDAFFRKWIVIFMVYLPY